MSFDSRLGRARLALSRLASLAGQLPFREAAIRFVLDINTIHAKIRFALAKTKDAATRFALAKTADAAIRFKLRAQGYKDAALRVQFYLTGGPISGQVLYFRDLASIPGNTPANGPISGLAQLSSPAVSLSGSPYENRSLSLQKGSSETSFSATHPGGGVNDYAYMGRFIGPPLAAQHVSAGAWEFGFGARETVGNLNNVLPTLLIWRPSTQSVVVYIRDWVNQSLAAATTTKTGYIRATSVGNSGSGANPAFDVLDGDVPIVEWFCNAVSFGGVWTLYFNGGTIPLVDGDTAATDIATYIKAPQALNFLNPAEAKLRFKLLGSGVKDAQLRFRLQTFKNAGLRFHMRYPTNYRDAQLLVWIRQGGYYSAQLRLNLKHYVYHETTVRLNLQPGDIYRDATLRAVFRPLAYKDPALRVNLPNFTYRDAALHFAIRAATAFQNAGMRLMLPTISAREPTCRFQLEDPGWQGLALLNQADPNGPPKWFIGDGF